SWAAAVAGLSIMATTLRWAGYEEVLARAEPRLDPGDMGSRRYLRMWSSIVASLWDFDPAPATELAAAAERDGDDHAAMLHAIVRACCQVNPGRLDDADTAIDVVRRVLGRRGLPLAHHTAAGIVGLAAFTATHRGDLERARTIADTAGQANASPNILVANA